jgi:hypothetical protein
MPPPVQETVLRGLSTNAHAANGIDRGRGGLVSIAMLAAAAGLDLCLGALKMADVSFALAVRVVIRLRHQNSPGHLINIPSGGI